MQVVITVLVVFDTTIGTVSSPLYNPIAYNLAD